MKGEVKKLVLLKGGGERESGVPWSKVTATRYLEPQVRDGPQVGTTPNPTEHDMFPSLNASHCVSFTQFTFTGLAVLCRHLESLATGAIVATAGQVRAVLFAPAVLCRTVHDHLGTFVWNIRKTWECECENWDLISVAGYLYQLCEQTPQTLKDHGTLSKLIHVCTYTPTRISAWLLSFIMFQQTEQKLSEKLWTNCQDQNMNEWLNLLNKEQKQYQYFMIDWANSQKKWTETVTYGSHSRQRHRHSPAHCCRLWTRVHIFCWHTWTAQHHRCWSGCS